PENRTATTNGASERTAALHTLTPGSFAGSAGPRPTVRRVSLARVPPLPSPIPVRVRRAHSPPRTATEEHHPRAEQDPTSEPRPPTCDPAARRQAAGGPALRRARHPAGPAPTHIRADAAWATGRG